MFHCPQVTAVLNERNKAFVLMVVLMVLAVAAVFLSASARICCRRALEASDAREELQLRWGSLCCEQACLDVAERLLREVPPKDGLCPVSTSRSIVLGGRTFHLIVSDEQAKANVNGIAQRRRNTALPELLRSLEPDLDVALAELAETERRIRQTKGSDQQFVSLDQLFAFSHPSQLTPSLSDQPFPRNTTCWGSGKLNVRRASLPAMRQAFDGVLNLEQVHRLDQYRRQYPDFIREELLRHLQLTDKQLPQLEPLLVDASSCHSLWIVADCGTRRRYRLVVKDSSKQDKGERRWYFAW